MAKKKADPLAKKVADLDEFKEYAPMKKEITDRVKELGVNTILGITGDRNYHLESDGTIIMQYGHISAPIAKWNAEQWAYFKADVKQNHLLKRLDELK
jgi:uncharacterized membrane protein